MKIQGREIFEATLFPYEQSELGKQEVLLWCDGDKNVLDRISHLNTKFRGDRISYLNFSIELRYFRMLEYHHDEKKSGIKKRQ